MTDTKPLQEQIAEDILDYRRRNFEDKRDRRIERTEERITKNRKLASSYYESSNRRSEHIPFGQPVMVGHHSEKRHRRDLSRIRGDMDKSVAATRTAEYYEGKLAAMNTNTAISSDDPDAIDKLKEKIAAAEELQEFYKAGNKIAKSRKSDADKIEALKAAGHCPSILSPDFAGRIGYPSYKLSNNNANIRRMRERLKDLEQRLAAAVEAEGEPEETRYEDLGLTTRRNHLENRFQLEFDGKPVEAVRKLLKAQGYRWAPSQGAWQRHLTCNSEPVFINWIPPQLRSLMVK